MSALGQKQTSSLVRETSRRDPRRQRVPAWRMRSARLGFSAHYHIELPYAVARASFLRQLIASLVTANPKPGFDDKSRRDSFNFPAC